MRKYYAILIFAIILSIFTGCTQSSDIDPSGAWYLSKLEDYSTKEEVEFDSEAIYLKEDGTGIEIYLPCDYYEEYSYITWKVNQSSTSDYITIKYDENYKYNLKIESITNNKLKCSFYFDEDNDQLFLATYTKMNEGMFDYIGCWSYTDYILDNEYYDTKDSFFYFYPDGKMEQIYYELDDEQIIDTGEWSVRSNSLKIGYDDSSSISKFDTYINNNLLEIYEPSDGDSNITYVYKRYYGQITNTPPVTYPQNSFSIFSSIVRYFSTIFQKISNIFS